LHIEFRRLSVVVKPIAINSALVNAVELPLEVIQVCLAEGPRRRNRELIKVVADPNEDFVLWPERFGYLTLSRAMNQYLPATSAQMGG
jgi:hypothetical protein